MEQSSYSFRVSTLPSVFLKESLIIRLLLQNHAFPLTSLSFSKSAAHKLMELVQNRQGLLFLREQQALASLLHSIP